MNKVITFNYLNLHTYNAAIPFSGTRDEICRILDEKGATFKQFDNKIVTKSEVFAESGLFAISFAFDGEKLVSIALSPIAGDENMLLSHFDEIQKKLETMLGKTIHPIQGTMNFLDKRGRQYKWKTQNILIEHLLRDRFGLEEVIIIRKMPEHGL